MPKGLKFVFLPVLASTLTMLASSSAQAQTNLSAGYQFAHVSASNVGETYPVGWYVDASAGVAPMVAVVGQVAAIYKSVDGVTLRAYDFLGGVRLVAKSRPAVTPFVQALGGAVNAGGGGTSNTAFSLQLGGGVDLKATPAFKLRLAADYRRNFFSTADGGGDNVIAGMIGLVFGAD